MSVFIEDTAQARPSPDHNSGLCGAYNNPLKKLQLFNDTSIIMQLQYVYMVKNKIATNFVNDKTSLYS